MEKKTVLLGISGGIAAFKSVQLTSDLIKKGYDVEVIMTPHACEFVKPLSFEALTNHNVCVDMFDSHVVRSTKHISLAKKANVFMIVPATANVIAKIVHGIADDMLTTTFLAATCPKIIAPAMNTNMYENPITQNNLALCRSYGYHVVDAANGFLACGDHGNGKLADLSILMEAIEDALQTEKPLQGKKVVITGGPTQEAIDPVRYITNHSSGKMGHALAVAAKRLGASVTYIHGPINLPAVYGADDVAITSAQELFTAVKDTYADADFIIMAAAVGDYRCSSIAAEKIKKNDAVLTLELTKNPDILAWLGEHVSAKCVLCGFAMETQDLLAHATDKFKKKHCDLLVANSLKTSGAGFQCDTNIVTIISETQSEELPIMDKSALAYEIWERLIALHHKK